MARPSSGGDHGTLPTGAEPISMDVEYMPASQLQPLDDPAHACQVCFSTGASDWRPDPDPACLSAHIPRALSMQTGVTCLGIQAMLRDLDSSDWTTVVGALTTARQLVAHHPDVLLQHL